MTGPARIEGLLDEIERALNAGPMRQVYNVNPETLGAKNFRYEPQSHLARKGLRALAELRESLSVGLVGCHKEPQQ